jgi:DNA-binding response OmpR family regulator/ligand-binding sensor domain-containing protein/signal transduction histidine kinase
LWIFSTFVSRLLILFLWISFASMLLALDPDKTISQHSVHTWNIEGGLPGNSVFAVEQTRDGYLWIGTKNGLVRFDGINFELYNKKKIHQLKCNMIRALYQDRNGTLWIGTDSGGLTRYKQGQFTTYPLSENNALFKIKAINQDRWGNLWFGSFTGGLTCLHSGKFTTYTTKQGLPHNQVTFIFKDTNGDLWVTTAAGIVKLLQPGVFQGYASPDILPYMKTVCFYDMDRAELWIGTGERGLYRLKEGKYTAYGTESGLPHPTITCIYKDRMKNLWIGTDGGGLSLMRSGVFSTLSGSDGLECGFISSISEDREGSLWVGTLDGGLHQLKDGKFTNYTTREGLVHDYINCICESRANGLRIGSKAGVSQLHDGKLTTILTFGNGLLDEVVECLYEDPAGYLWIGTWKGLQRFKPGNLDTFTTKQGLSDNRIKCILGDYQGDIWVATENGLNRLSYINNKWTTFTTGQGLSGNIIHLLFEDSKGTLWISTDGGLNTFKNGIISVYNLGTGIENSVVRCIYEDKGGVSWFGTDSGLLRLKNHQSSFYTDESGLVENYVCSILEDDRGYLWLAGRNGISRIKKEELEAFSKGEIPRLQPNWYNEKDGMKSGWCTGAGCKTRDGRFWFPTSKGVTTIDPNHIKPNSFAPSLIFEKLIADGETFTLKSTLELAPGKKRLEFYYTAVSFIHPEKIRFKLKLLGYDSDWVKVGTARHTIYTGLSPGQYTFRVTACNPDGIWNEAGASFSFSLRPYFYQTPWFYLLGSLFIFLAGFSFYRFRVRQLKAREKELSTQVELRTRDLKEHAIKLESAHHRLQQSKELIEEKNLQLEDQAKQLKELDEVKSNFFANISHEFRTPLTLIMGPLEQILSENPGKEMEAKANLMLRNSRRLLNLINQLLELAKFESGKMQLQASFQDIVPFVKNIVMCFESLALQKKVGLSFQGQEQDISVYFDSEKLEIIITNLLANAFNYLSGGGKITVSVRRVEGTDSFPTGCVEISVRDTGPGIPKHQLPHIFDRFYRGTGSHGFDRKGAGIGLALSKDLVELHHGEIRVQSSCRDDHTRGTEFIIRLPTGKEHLKSDEIADPGDTGIVIRDVFPQPEADEHKQKLLRGAARKAPCDNRLPIILVVEDNPIERLFIKVTLELQYNVIEAADGEEGILRAKEIIPDLIVSDIIMPVIDGYELCHTLKQDVLTSHIPIILLTAKGSEESVLQGLETGADDYITKPFSKSLLVARAGNLMELRRQLQMERKSRITLQPERVTVLPLDDEFYKKLQDTVEVHLSDPDFNVEGLSGVLQMSQATLYRKIHALTGKTPTSFIRSYRIKRAAQLLEAHAGNVSEVADKVGFLDKSYFAMCFKEQFHCLPSDIKSSGVSGPVDEHREKREVGKAEDRGQMTIKTTANEKLLRGVQGGGFLEKSPPGRRRQEIILVVEDSDDARQYIRESLEPEYRVVEAADGSEGTARAVEIIPDLVISDIMMPEVDGYELCRVLKKDVRTSHIPIILLTAKAAEEDMIRGLETGADDYITKPFNTKILHARLKNLILLRSHLQKNRNREMALLPGKIFESEIDRDFMKELNSIIKKNLSDPEFNVDQLGKKLYMSRLTLYRKILAISGETPSEFIRSHRLRRGAQLLERNFGSVLEVAFEVGFSNSSYFAKCFKETFHQSPSDYQVSKAK